MQKGFYNNRGISPLIATVLLIGFVIVIGVLVWLFYSGTIADLGEKVECGPQEGISLSFTATFTCDGSNALITTTNDGTEQVDAWWFVFSGGGAATASAPTINPVKPGASVEHGVSVANCASLESVEIIPGVVIDKKAQFCTDATRKVVRS